MEPKVYSLKNLTNLIKLLGWLREKGRRQINKTRNAARDITNDSKDMKIL